MKRDHHVQQRGSRVGKLWQIIITYPRLYNTSQVGLMA